MTERAGISLETEAALRNLCEATGREFTICPRCRCCEVETMLCDDCGGEGVAGHDCGEDTCCCLWPEENMPCDTCGGKGAWAQCLGRCDENGKHA